MSQVILKDGEIKELKENINKIEQEAQKRDESVSHLKKENVVLHENVYKLNTMLKGKVCYKEPSTSSGILLLLKLPSYNVLKLHQ